MTDVIDEWATGWGLPPEAVLQLRAYIMPPAAPCTAVSETDTQNRIRVEAAQRGGFLWRNNNGACRTNDGRTIRYGLGNDSKRINERFKSPDLVGIFPVTVQQRHIGQTLGVFAGIEIKHPDWQGPENDRDRAQAAFLAVIAHRGGIATFATDVSHLKRAIERI